ncbi:mediator of RNA polymerase II transcription subunit 26 [Asbolus verrucosus]|uniref:Mediator of RNA polymerase II transcription subunit 26 n=1 Tax=Asbolus verrucosus TaxID=1661398 RepID=A0A482VI59_ASBVE|nr:mediator of RNA polymerase II transcription subunit 26 [Asbolus verrucosus]
MTPEGKEIFSTASRTITVARTITDWKGGYLRVPKFHHCTTTLSSSQVLGPTRRITKMEPLVHYSQRDPLYGTNVLSLNADGQNEDLLTDNNHLTEHVYGPPRQVIERPIYIKEPEPIIEIIIKESNVTLPPPPAPPTPAPKKKEQVQVFYVKYKKNPNGHGKDSIIYDKPVPAISPPVQDEHEEAPPQPYHHQEVVTSPPPPSTTLRTIIRPDSEIYHSPSGVKVTFGKESFDYDKRSNKPEDLKASAGDFQQQYQQPQFQQQSPQQPSIIPPGGELIHSLSKFEQHISVPSSLQSQHQPQPQLQQQSSHLSAAEYNEKIQQQFREANALQQSIQQSIPQQSLPQHAFPQQSFSQQSFPQQSFLQQSFPQQSSYEFQKSQQLSFGQTTSKPTTYSTTPSTTTTTTARTTTQEPEKASTTTKDPKILNAQLPDEVPDELREQLLSSGILNNADISVLDYDKVGDIPLSALPPEQLANFYSAGGAQQIQAAGSAPIPSVVDREGSAVDFEPEASEIHEVTVKPEVQMKVVHYDPQSDRGRQVQESYVKEDATQVEPVVLNDESYNRYLPLKVSGAQFPIPDVPELKGKKISSVVVLAPVAYDFSSARKARQVKEEEIELIEGGALKELLKEPSLLNFNKFLESENKTRSDKQAVILLVTGPSDGGEEKEIFMYDVATRSVSKLNGELSSAFVEAAEANSSDTKASASEIVETRVPYDRVPVIDPESDLETEASDHLERFVDVSEVAVEDDDPTAGALSDYDAAKTGRLPSP